MIIDLFMVVIEKLSYRIEYLKMSNFYSNQNINQYQNTNVNDSMDTFIQHFVENQKQENKLIVIKFFLIDCIKQFRYIKLKDLIFPGLSLLTSGFTYKLFIEKAKTVPKELYYLMSSVYLIIFWISIIIILFSMIHDLLSSSTQNHEDMSLEESELEKNKKTNNLAINLSFYDSLSLKMKEKEINETIINLEKIETVNIVIIPIIIFIVLLFAQSITGISIQVFFNKGNHITSSIFLLIIATTIFALIKSSSNLVAYKRALIAIQKAQILKKYEKED